MTMPAPASSNSARLVLLLLLACAGMASPARSRQPARTGEQPAAGNWNRFVMMVYQYKVPEPGPEAKRLYESVNLRALHLDNGFSEQLLDFARANHYPYYVDHSAGKG